MTGPQTIDGVKVYFNPGGVQVKGGFGWDGHYYDKDSGALVTNKFVEEYGRTYYVDEMVIRQLVLKKLMERGIILSSMVN